MAALEKGRIFTSENANAHVDQDVAISTPEGPAHASGIGNPGPMGLFAFASTTFIVSMYNVQTRGVTHPNVVVGMGIFSGGLTQFVAGMWQFPRGNVFGATVFSSYGAFWMSYATILIPGSGIMSAYSDPDELANAIGIYLISWFMLTLFFLLGVIRKNIAYTVLLSLMTAAFACLAVAQFTQSLMVTKAGGVLGIAGSFVAYYVGVSEMFAADERPLVRLPLGVW
ncbi:GPR1/FUN34/yaaH family-domain-containing protein [Mycena latifolia]|nr:GPR1/FUN34/yaaH family-domain-containing protein [Mycena latifolia]